MPLLGLDIGEEELFQRLLPGGAPGEGFRQHGLQRPFGIDRVGIDGKAGGLARKATLLAGESDLVAHQVHEIGRVLPVEDGEAGQ